MDVEMMRQYYCDTYQCPTDAAIENSREFEQKRNIRYKMEEKLTQMMGGKGSALFKAFDDYVTAMADEHNVIEEAMYLMGARDRERMLR